MIDTNKYITDTEINKSLDAISENEAYFSRWKAIVVVGCLAMIVMSIALVMVLSIVNLNLLNDIKSSNLRHHQQTIVQQNDIKSLLTQHSVEIKTVKKIALQEEKVDSQIPAADAVLYAEVVYLNNCVQHISQNTNTACTEPPNLKSPK